MRQAETRHSTWPPGDPLQTRTLERVWQLWLERYIKNNFKNYYLSKSWSKDSNLNRSLLRVPNNRMDDLGQLLNASWHFINPLNSASVDCLWQPSYLVVAIGKLRKQISRSTRSFIHSFLHKVIHLTSTYEPGTVAALRDTPVNDDSCSFCSQIPWPMDFWKWHPLWKYSFKYSSLGSLFSGRCSGLIFVAGL